VGAFAQYFSDSLAKHTRKGLKERAIKGFHLGGIPFGYVKCDCCEAGVHPKEQEADPVTSALSGNFLGDSEMLFMGTDKGFTDPLCQFFRGEQTIGVDHPPHAMNPFWLDGIEPRTLRGKTRMRTPFPRRLTWRLCCVIQP